MGIQYTEIIKYVTENGQVSSKDFESMLRLKKKISGNFKKNGRKKFGYF